MTDAVRKAVDAAYKRFDGLVHNATVEDEAAAIEAALRVVELDPARGLLCLWLCLNELEHPLARRTLAFLAARDATTSAADFVCVDLMAKSHVDDVATCLNLVSAADRGLDAAGLIGLYASLPRFLYCHALTEEVVRDAITDLLVDLEDSERRELFPNAILLETKARLEGVADVQRIVPNATELLAEVKAVQAAATAYASLVSHLEALGATDLKHGAQITGVVQRLRAEALACAASLQKSVRVQAVRVSQDNKAPSLPVVTRVSTSWASAFISACEDEALLLEPLSANEGSFILNLAVRNTTSSESGFEALRALASTAVTSTSLTFDIRPYARLIESLASENASIDAIMVDGLGMYRQPTPTMITITSKHAKVDLADVTRLALIRLDSGDIPQADAFDRIFRLVDLLHTKTDVTAATLEVTARQVNYYKQAGRILGLLDDDNELTGAGRQLAKLDADRRCLFCAIRFEESKCGSAWLTWADAPTLVNLDPATAEKFLLAASTLSAETAKRRAQTLAAWHTFLVPFHYSKWKAP